MLSRFFLALVACGACSAAMAQDKPPVADAVLTADRFKPIIYADLEKLETSGCSFSVFQGKKHIAFWDNQESGPGVSAEKPRFWFKIDGKMVRVTGDAKKASKTENLGVWTGKVAGQDLRISEGRVDPKFKNDGGSIGGAGKMEWNGGSLPIRWEMGC